jgi:hypothetical protein
LKSNPVLRLGDILFGTFLDKATSLLDRRFLIAYWFPVFLAAAVITLIRVLVYGWKAALDWWQQDYMLKGQAGGFYAQVWFIVGFLVVTAVFAYLLQPFTRPLIRFYEGYWPSIFRKLFTWLPLVGERSIWRRKAKQQDTASDYGDLQTYNHLQAQLFYGYPQKEGRLMPTKLGNSLRSAEDYSKDAYGMDSVFWWPRLWPLLPDNVRNEVDDSLVPIVALLNFSSLIIVVAIIGSVYLWKEDLNWQIPLEQVWMVHVWPVLLIGGLLLAWISYRAAVSQAQAYGEKIRAAIDLYRFDLLKALHQPLPETLNEEIALWDRLILWLYTNDRNVVSDMKYYHGEKTTEKSPQDHA